jgi:hypothetical protein
VCGIPAHGYYLHNLHRYALRWSKTTGDKDEKRKYLKESVKYRNRAFMFAFALIDPEIQDEI